MASPVFPALLCVLAVCLAGCSTTKSKPVAEKEKVHQRGWIGGEFKLARKGSIRLAPFGPREEFIGTFPRGLASSNRAGLLITGLSSNAPAYQAGLREGDLILAFNHEPVTTLRAFRQRLDGTDPGASLAIATWRDGQFFDYNVSVGRETFKYWGVFSVSLSWPNLSTVGPLDLWPDPGFDLGPVGFEPTHGDRTELGSPAVAYQRACGGDKYTPSNQDWKAWLAIFSVAKGKNILSQENVPARSALASPTGAATR